MGDPCNICGTGVQPCFQEHEYISQFFAIVPEDHRYGMNVPCKGVKQFKHYIKRSYFSFESPHLSTYRMVERDYGNHIRIGGVGWDCFCCDYNIKRGDTIEFHYNCVDFIMYMSPVNPDGEPKPIILDVHDEGAMPVAYSNDMNFTWQQKYNMDCILDVYNYPMQVHCFTAANIYDHTMVIHRSIVRKLGLQEYGTTVLEMHRQTQDSILADYHIKSDGHLEIKGSMWKKIVSTHEVYVDTWVVILAIRTNTQELLTLRFKQIAAEGTQQYSSDDSDDSDDED